MPRHKMTPGTWGEIFFTTLDDGTVRGRVWYRTLGGARKDTTALGKSKAAVERTLKARLPKLVSAAAVPAAGEAPKTFAETAMKWLEYEEMKLPEHEKAPTTHHEHRRIIRAHLIPHFGNTLRVRVG